MAFDIQTATEAAGLHGVKILVYGRAGVGKTVLCSTAPRPLILSAESGLLSLRNSNVHVVKIRNIEDLEEVYQWATESREADNYDTFCLDSITEIGEQVLSYAKENVKDVRQAYGELIDRMGVLIKKFRDLEGKHVYMSGKQERVKDDATGKVTFGLAMPGAKLAQQIPYLFDEMFCLNIGADEQGEYRYLMTQPTLQYDAKDRSGSLSPVEEPDLTAIINKIMADTGSLNIYSSEEESEEVTE